MNALRKFIISIKYRARVLKLRIRFMDRPDLADLVASEQFELDEMWEYLEKREARTD